MSMFATFPASGVRRRASALPGAAFRALRAGLAAEFARRRAVRARRRELDDLLMSEERVFRDIGLDRLDVVHERLAIRTWF